MIRINLIPPEYLAAQDKKNQQILFGTSGGALVLILLVFWFFKSRQAANLQIQISQDEANLAKLQSIVSQIERIESDKAQLTAKRDLIQGLNRSRLTYPVLFEDLLPIIPSDVWLSNIQVSDSAGQMKIVMNSNATSNFALATWLSNLQQSTHFSNIDLSAISYTNGEQGSQLSFSINCIYSHKGPFPLSGLN